MRIYSEKAFVSAPSCVLLDLDNTLYDYAPCDTAGMNAARGVAQQLLNISSTDFNRCFADARVEVKARLGSTGAAHNRLLYFQRTIERAGFASQPFVGLQLEQAFWRAYLDAAVLFPSVQEFLDDLRIGGIPTVIVSDLTAQIQFRKLILLGLDRLVDWVVTSEESGRDKPDPASFELALAKIGGVEGIVWMIGDDIRRDLMGARQAIGALTLQKLCPRSSPAAGAHEADAVFESFQEIRKMLRVLLENRGGRT
ncbi:MAG: HAD family hydrolase [Pseudomonadota bacterium]|nr:HAD family hydrolase [Pseudomonadota bacterium]